MSQQQYPPPYQTGPTTNTTAIISLIMSILGLVGILPLIGGIIGVVTGNMAKTDIARSGGTQTGEGLAQAGVIVGWIGILLWAVGICLGVLIFGGSLGVTLCALFAGSRQSLLPLILPFV
jgi:Domain of unknown function (DUF4190)